MSSVGEPRERNQPDLRETAFDECVRHHGRCTARIARRDRQKRLQRAQRCSPSPGAGNARSRVPGTARRKPGTSTLIGHCPTQDLQARQPSIASLTACEKSSRLRANVLRCRAYQPSQGAVPAHAGGSSTGSDSRARKLAQPLPHQRGPALRRMAALARRLPGRAHGIVRIEVVAGAVAVAVQRGLVEASPHVRGIVRSSCPRVGTPSIVSSCLPRRCGDLAGVQLVVRVERRLDRLERG